MSETYTMEVPNDAPIGSDDTDEQKFAGQDAVLQMAEQIGGLEVGVTDMQYVIDEVRGIFKDDELAERVLREPSFAKRILEGEPFRPYAFFDAVREIGKIDPNIAARMITKLHGSGAIKTLFDENAVQLEGASSEDEERFRIDRLLFISLNKAGLKEGELIKESGETVMIERAVAHVNSLRVAFGVPEIGLSEGDYRMMPEGSLGEDTSGSAELGEEEMLIVRKNSAIAKLKLIVHESVHFASDVAMSYKAGDDVDYPTAVAKSGFQEREGEMWGMTKLKWLDEAITEEIAARYVKGLREDDPDFGEIVKENARALGRYEEAKDRIKFPEGTKLTEAPLAAHFSEDGKVELSFVTYADARNDLWELAADIYAKNPSAFEGQSKEVAAESVFALLVKAKFSGNTIPFALLYDATYGSGTFASAMRDDSERLRNVSSRELYREEGARIRIYQDEQFPGSVIVREDNTGYALRKNATGDLEGNQIDYLEDGSIGAVYQLHQNELAELEQNGIVDLALTAQVGGNAL